MANKVIFITTTSGSPQTFNVPVDWNNLNNTVECIGGGGAGGSLANAGAGGGAYAIKPNVTLTAGGTTSFQIGTAAAGSATANGVNGTDTWFISAADVLAKAGAGNVGTTAGTGGLAASCVPSTGAFSGGSGGAGGASSSGGAGGGGAGGINGAGKNGGAVTGTSLGGSGGGGAGGGSATDGVADSLASGSDGGKAQDNTAGGVGTASGTSPSTGGAGSHGSGGGGGGSATGANAGASGGAGGNGIEWDSTHGSGGGGAGAGGSVAGIGGAGGAGGTYGGGGGCGAFGVGGNVSGGAGGQGIIVLTYSPLLSWLPAVSQGKLLKLTQKGGSLLAGVITPQPAAVFNYKSVYPDAIRTANGAFYLSSNTPFIVPTTAATVTSIPWLPTFDDINPTKPIVNGGWFAESTNEETATNFPQWLSLYPGATPKNTFQQNTGTYSLPQLPAVTNFPQWNPKYDDKIPPAPLQKNTGSITFNPYAISPASFQTLSVYPDRLLAVPTIFPAGAIASTTPQNVVIPSLNWLPTFSDKTPPNVFQLTTGWYTTGRGAGSTVFPAWQPTFVDTVPPAFKQPNTGWYTEGVSVELSTFPQWAPLFSDRTQRLIANYYTEGKFSFVTLIPTPAAFPDFLPVYVDKVPPAIKRPNVGEYKFVRPFVAVASAYPQWLPLYPSKITKAPRDIDYGFIAFQTKIPAPIPGFCVVSDRSLYPSGCVALSDKLVYLSVISDELVSSSSITDVQ